MGNIETSIAGQTGIVAQTEGAVNAIPTERKEVVLSMEDTQRLPVASRQHERTFDPRKPITFAVADRVDVLVGGEETQETEEMGWLKALDETATAEMIKVEIEAIEEKPKGLEFPLNLLFFRQRKNEELLARVKKHGGMLELTLRHALDELAYYCVDYLQQELVIKQDPDTIYQLFLEKIVGAGQLNVPIDENGVALPLETWTVSGGRVLSKRDFARPLNVSIEELHSCRALRMLKAIRETKTQEAAEV